MRTKRGLYLSVAAVAIALALGAPSPVSAQQAAPPSIGSTDIGGVVTGPKGPEAGVWVIAETTDLPTRMSKTVVTDDQGRYVIPDLPKANYVVWARGYGLVDSAKTTTSGGWLANHLSVAWAAMVPGSTLTRLFPSNFSSWRTSNIRRQ